MDRVSSTADSIPPRSPAHSPVSTPPDPAQTTPHGSPPHSLRRRPKALPDRLRPHRSRLVFRPPSRTPWRYPSARHSPSALRKPRSFPAHSAHSSMESVSAHPMSSESMSGYFDMSTQPVGVSSYRSEEPHPSSEGRESPERIHSSWATALHPRNSSPASQFQGSPPLQPLHPQAPLARVWSSRTTHSTGQLSAHPADPTGPQTYDMRHYPTSPVKLITELHPEPRPSPGEPNQFTWHSQDHPLRSRHSNTAHTPSWRRSYDYNHSDSSSRSSSLSSPPLTSPPPPPPRCWAQLRASLSAEAQVVIARLRPPGAMTRLIRSVLTFAISTLFILISSIEKWIGKYSYLLPFSTIFLCSAPTIGAHVEAMVLAYIGLALAFGYSLLGRFAAEECNRRFLQNGNHGARAILAVWLFVGLFQVSLFRVRNKRYYIPSILFCFPLILTMTAKVDNTTGAVAFVWAYFKPLIFGANIALVSGIVFFPVSAIFVLEKHVLTVMCRVLKVLDITTKAFLLRDSSAILTPQQFGAQMANVRQAMSALKEAALEAKYEISYSNHKPEDFDAIQNTLLLISQHLGSMTLSAQNERYLMNARVFLDQRTTCNEPTGHPPDLVLPLPRSDDGESTPVTEQSSGMYPYTPAVTMSACPSRPSSFQAGPGLHTPSVMSLDQPALIRRKPSVPKELAKADRKIFMQLLHSFGPSIQELSYLCELTLDRCVHQFIKNCEGFIQSSATVRIVNELPDDLLIHNYSVIEARYQKRAGDQSHGFFVNLYRHLIGLHTESEEAKLSSSEVPHHGKPAPPAAERGSPRPEPESPSTHPRTSASSVSIEIDDQGNFNRVVRPRRLSQLFAGPRMDVPENPAVPGGEKAAEATSGGEGSPTPAPAPSPSHSERPENQIPHPVRSNDPLSDADMQDFVNQIQQAIARFDKLEVTAIRKVYRHTMNVVGPTGPRDSHREPGGTGDGPSDSGNPALPFEEPREEAFLIFFFLFSLREVALLLSTLVTQIHTLQLARSKTKRLWVRWNGDARWLFRHFRFYMSGLLFGAKPRPSPKKSETDLRRKSQPTESWGTFRQHPSGRHHNTPSDKKRDREFGKMPVGTVYGRSTGVLARPAQPRPPNVSSSADSTVRRRRYGRRDSHLAAEHNELYHDYREAVRQVFDENIDDTNSESGSESETTAGREASYSGCNSPSSPEPKWWSRWLGRAWPPCLTKGSRHLSYTSLADRARSHSLELRQRNPNMSNADQTGPQPTETGRIGHSASSPAITRPSRSFLARHSPRSPSSNDPPTQIQSGHQPPSRRNSVSTSQQIRTPGASPNFPRGDSFSDRERASSLNQFVATRELAGSYPPAPQLSSDSNPAPGSDVKGSTGPASTAASPWAQRRAAFLYQLWLFSRFLKSNQIHYATKLSLTITLICFPAWFDASMNFFVEQRMQWLVVAFLIVLSPTIGRTLLMAIYRIIGTSLAVIASVVGWYMTTGNRYGLFIVTLVFSIPAFYVVLFTPHKSVGYLSANVFTITVFTLYTNNQGDDTILTLAYKRLWNTLAGILVALVINAWLWPRIARVELRHFTALGLDTLGNIFSRLVAKLVIHPLLNPQNHFFKLYLEHVRWQEAQQELSMLGGTSRKSSSALSLPPKWTEKAGRQLGPTPYSLLGASTIDINDIDGNMVHTGSGGGALPPSGLMQRFSSSHDPHADTSSRLSRILSQPQVASLLPTDTFQSIASNQSQSLSVHGLRFHPPGRFDAPTSLTTGERVAALDVDYPYIDFPPTRAVLRPHEQLNSSIVKGTRKMQDLLGRSQIMLQESALEPRLQGPFPKAVYAEILDRLQNILDRLISMSITTDYISPQVHHAIITPFNQHGRRDMTAAILINFYSLAGALRSKAPLPPYLPSGRAARIRLIQQIKSHMAQDRPHLDKNSTYELPGDDSDSDDEDSDLGRTGQRGRGTDTPLPSGAKQWTLQNPRSQPAYLHEHTGAPKLSGPPTASWTRDVNGGPSAPGHPQERDGKTGDVSSERPPPPSTLNGTEKAMAGNQANPAPQPEQGKRAAGSSDSTAEPLDQTPISRSRPRHRRSSLAPTDNQYLAIHHNPHRRYNQYVPTHHSHLVPTDQVDGAGNLRSPLASFDEGNESEDEDEWLSMPPRRTSCILDQTLTNRYLGEGGVPFEAPLHASNRPLGPGPSHHYSPPPKGTPPVDANRPSTGKPPDRSQRPPRKYMLSTFYWYAYSAALEEVIEELENIVILVKSLVGENDVLHELLDSPGW